MGRCDGHVGRRGAGTCDLRPQSSPLWPGQAVCDQCALRPYGGRDYITLPGSSHDSRAEPSAARCVEACDKAAADGLRLQRCVT